MIKKISDLLRNNFWLKLLSLIIAVVIWYVVVGVSDPIITRSFTVKVTTANETYIQNGKQLFRIEDEYKSILVYLRGNRSTLRDIKADDITVTADLTQIVDLDATPVMVPLSVTCPGVDRSNITMSRTAIPITIEEIASREFPVVVDTGDTKPTSTYEVGATTANPEKVTLSGPKSVVDNIDTVVARIDVTGMTYSGVRSASMVLYDKNMSEIPAGTIEDDLTFSTGTSNVTVSVELWQRVSDVSLNVEYEGTPMSGYQIGTISTTPETITVVGNDEALAALAADGNEITIPADYINVDGASGDLNVEVDLTELMPGNMRIAANTASVVDVLVPVMPEGSRELVIDVDDIQETSLNEELTVSYDQTEVTVLISGNEEALARVTTADLQPSINCKDLTEGDYDLTLELKIPEEVQLVNSVKITVHIKQAARTE